MNIKLWVGSRIKELRSQQKLSQLVLSCKSDVDRTYISQVENGKRNIAIVNLQKICNTLGITLQEFFQGYNND